MTTLPPRAVIVTRPSELDELVKRHGTLPQARFYLRSRGVDPEELARRHDALEAARHAVASAIPLAWRRAHVSRAELDRFLFEPEDLIVAVGQDGLVANVAKYLSGQPVAGINPAPGLIEGVLVRHTAAAASDLYADFARGRSRCEERTMVEARLSDGQRLIALNEIFIGHRTHQSARYRIAFGEASERQSSSGVLIATGTGATGWAKSVTHHREGAPPLPTPSDAALAFLVREAWPSRTTGASLTDGLIGPSTALTMTSEMNDGGTIFGDGLEDDRIEWPWSQTATLGLAPERLRLIAA
jgi:hypothetical protein